MIRNYWYENFSWKSSMIVDSIYFGPCSPEYKCTWFISEAYIETSIHRHVIGENLLNNFHLNFLTFQVELFGSNRNIWASKRLNFVSMKYCNVIYSQKIDFNKNKVCFLVSVFSSSADETARIIKRISVSIGQKCLNLYIETTMYFHRMGITHFDGLSLSCQ